MSGLKICSPQLGIAPVSNSGGEVYDREILTALSKRDVKIFCYLPKNRDYPKIKNLVVDLAPVTHMVPPYVFNLFVFGYLQRMFKKNNFDILRVHSPYFTGPAALLFKKMHPKVPIVASYLHLEETSLIQPLIDKLLIYKYDHIITISNFTKDEIIRRYSVPAARITVAYPGIDRKYYPRPKNKALLRKYKLTGKKIILFLGGLKIRKNPLFLLKLADRLDRDTVLLIAGDGSLKQQMVNYVNKNCLQHFVVFTGFVPEKIKADYYNLSDIVLLPSLKEGFGMIAAEAQACGKPVIASDNSSLPEIIDDGKTGYLAVINDIDDWINKISILFNNEKLRLTMGISAQKAVRNKFSWDKSARIHEKIYKNLIR